MSIEEIPNTTKTVTGSPQDSPRPFLRWGAIIIAVGVTVTILLLADNIEQLQTLGYLGAFLIMLVSNATVVLPAPGILFVFAMGSTLNPWLLGLAAGTGAALGEMTGYLAGYGGATPLENTDLYRRFDGWMERFGPITILVLSIIPNPFFDVAGILAGASHMRVWIFLVATGCGKVIQAAILAWAGALSLEWVGQLFAA